MDVTRMDQSETIQMFKSKLRFQIRFQGLENIKHKIYFLRHGDFRQRISQEEEDIQSILNWYNRSEKILPQKVF